MLELYKNIREKRKKLKMTQTQLAELVGYTDKTMISKIESGNVDLGQTKIIAIANALGTTPKELMGWTDSSEAPTALRPDETELLTSYNKLNNVGKEKVRVYASDLKANYGDAPALLAAHARTDIAPDPEGQAEDINILLQMAESHKSDAEND